MNYLLVFSDKNKCTYAFEIWFKMHICVNTSYFFSYNRATPKNTHFLVSLSFFYYFLTNEVNWWNKTQKEHLLHSSKIVSNFFKCLKNCKDAKIFELCKKLTNWQNIFSKLIVKIHFLKFWKILVIQQIIKILTKPAFSKFSRFI